MVSNNQDTIIHADIAFGYASIRHSTFTLPAEAFYASSAKFILESDDPRFDELRPLASDVCSVLRDPYIPDPYITDFETLREIVTEFHHWVLCNKAYFDFSSAERDMILARARDGKIYNASLAAARMPFDTAIVH